MARRRLRIGTIQPEHQVYLLLHVLLFTTGLLIAQAGGTTWVAVGTSVAATGMCGWVIYFWLRLSEQGSRGRTRIQQIGIIDAFPARSVSIRPEYEHRFRAARVRIDFLGFGLRALREDFGGSFESWLERIHIRILLLDPEGPILTWKYATQRDMEESNRTGSIVDDVHTFLNYLAPIKNKYPNKLHVRLYSCIPTLNVCRIDDEIFWGPYLVGEQSRNTPTLLVGRYGSMYEILTSHYDHIWTDDRFSRDAFEYQNKIYSSVV